MGEASTGALMEVDRFKIYLQNYLSEGLMLVIGSGLSCAEGLPGMGQLTAAIDRVVSSSGARILLAEWSSLRAEIPKLGLEGALKARPPSTELGAMMTMAIAEAISEKEKPVVAGVLAGKRILPLSRLLPLISIGQGGLPILTTNYDRLVELACVQAGLSIDTLFDGDFIGRLSADRWQYSQVETVIRDRNRTRMRYRDFARVLKPHGSLDWWHTPDGPVRFTGELPEGRAIVTPGLLKYREGYNEPYNTHRNVANEQLSASARLMFLGYGFNDDHLEATSLLPLLQAGKEALILALSLTDNARALLKTLPKITAIEALDPAAGTGTQVHFRGETEAFPTEKWWDLSNLIEGVLAP